MNHLSTVYDLGEIEGKHPMAKLGPTIEAAAGLPGAQAPSSGADVPPRRGNPRPAGARVPRGHTPPRKARESADRDSFRDELKELDRHIKSPRRVSWRLSGSMSLLVPGSGQMAMGDYQLGFFYVCMLGWMVASGWAVLNTFQRIVGTLELFGLAAVTAFWMLAGTFFCGSLLYLSNVLGAIWDAEDHPGNPASPILSGTASGIVPGWGQVLNGDRVRAVLFLSTVLGLVAVGASLGPTARTLLGDLGLFLPYWSWLESAPTLKWTIPLLVWALAVYDAASSAVSRKRQKLKAT